MTDVPQQPAGDTRQGDLDGEQIGQRWRLARRSTEVTHLDAAAAARASEATIDAQTAFLRSESERGAYVAQLGAADLLAAARGTLAKLLGPELGADDVVFHQSASAAFAALLAAWPLSAPGPSGNRRFVGVVPGEFDSNLLALEARAAAAGVVLVDLPVDGQGAVDLDQLDRTGIADGRGGPPISLGDLALVVFPQVPSQRGVPQPAAEIGRRCADAGVPLIVDVAQSLGQTDTGGIGASAYVGTSRKWLCGPRGVGFVVVRPDVADQLGIGVPSGYSARHAVHTGDQQVPPVPLPGAARLATGEASIAAQVGLAHALGELVDAGPARLTARIAALAAYGRRVLDGAGGWQVRERLDEPTGIITLAPPPGTDPMAVRDSLYREERILISAIPVGRSRDLREPLLRASPHAYNIPADLDHLAHALKVHSPRSRGA